jgi:tetratricopeptide (TPR) repeat protein
MDLADWRARLRDDPRGTVAELARHLAAERCPDPEVEDLFWRAFADYGPPAELARAVLGRLRIEPPGEQPRADPELLDLDREHRVRVLGTLRLAAAEALAAVVRDPAERERIVNHPALLPDVALGRRGRPAEAAALYALEHDLLSPSPEAREAAGAEPLARAALRYQLARALHRVPGEAERAVAAMAAVVRDAAETPPAAEDPAAGASLSLRLSFHAREWLGLRHYEAGRYREAVREFLRAAEAAPDTDLEQAAGVFAANALIRDGRPEEAHRLLDSLRDRATQVSADLTQEWDALLRQLTESEPDGVDER